VPADFPAVSHAFLFDMFSALATRGFLFLVLGSLLLVATAAGLLFMAHCLDTIGPGAMAMQEYYEADRLEAQQQGLPPPPRPQMEDPAEWV
jgi:hypothetical protein